MTTYQFYFLVLSVASFVVFGGALASGYVRYRRWLRMQPPRRT
jgi:hypothetical protein